MNLEKIFDEVEADYEWQRTYPIDLCVEAMREAVKQALELAAERAEILDKETGISWMGILITDEASYEVDKKSILSVMDEIE